MPQIPNSISIAGLEIPMKVNPNLRPGMVQFMPKHPLPPVTWLNLHWEAPTQGVLGQLHELGHNGSWE